MTIEADMRTFLLGDGTLAGLISARLYPVILPQSPTFPAVSYQWISGTRYVTNDGPSQLSSPRLQFDCWSLSYTTTRAVSEALRKRLNGFKGLAGGSPPMTRIQGAFFESEREFYEPETKLYRHSADYFLNYSEQP